MAFRVRPSKPEDVPAIKGVLDKSMLFPAEMLDDMIGNHFDDKTAKEIWLSAEADGQVIGFC